MTFLRSPLSETQHTIVTIDTDTATVNGEYFRVIGDDIYFVDENGKKYTTPDTKYLVIPTTENDLTLINTSETSWYYSERNQLIQKLPGFFDKDNIDGVSAIRFDCKYSMNLNDTDGYQYLKIELPNKDLQFYCYDPDTRKTFFSTDPTTVETIWINDKVAEITPYESNGIKYQFLDNSGPRVEMYWNYYPTITRWNYRSVDYNIDLLSELESAEFTAPKVEPQFIKFNYTEDITKDFIYQGILEIDYDLVTGTITAFGENITINFVLGNQFYKIKASPLDINSKGSQHTISIISSNVEVQQTFVFPHDSMKVPVILRDVFGSEYDISGGLTETEFKSIKFKDNQFNTYKITYETKDNQIIGTTVKTYISTGLTETEWIIIEWVEGFKLPNIILNGLILISNDLVSKELARIMEYSTEIDPSKSNSNKVYKVEGINPIVDFWTPAEYDDASRFICFRSMLTNEVTEQIEVPRDVPCYYHNELIEGSITITHSNIEWISTEGLIQNLEEVLVYDTRIQEISYTSPTQLVGTISIEVDTYKFELTVINKKVVGFVMFTKETRLIAEGSDFKAVEDWYISDVYPHQIVRNQIFYLKNGYGLLSWTDDMILTSFNYYRTTDNIIRYSTSSVENPNGITIHNKTPSASLMKKPVSNIPCTSLTFMSAKPPSFKNTCTSFKNHEGLTEKEAVDINPGGRTHISDLNPTTERNSRTNLHATTSNVGTKQVLSERLYAMKKSNNNSDIYLNPEEPIRMKLSLLKDPFERTFPCIKYFFNLVPKYTNDKSQFLIMLDTKNNKFNLSNCTLSDSNNNAVSAIIPNNLNVTTESINDSTLVLGNIDRRARSIHEIAITSNSGITLTQNSAKLTMTMEFD